MQFTTLLAIAFAGVAAAGHFPSSYSLAPTGCPTGQPGGGYTYSSGNPWTLPPATVHSTGVPSGGSTGWPAPSANGTAPASYTTGTPTATVSASATGSSAAASSGPPAPSYTGAAGTFNVPALGAWAAFGGFAVAAAAL